MMRTIEVFLVIIIITGAFVISSLFAVLPSPRQVSPLNLRRLALTTLEILDSNYSLSEIVFKDPSDSSWNELQIALSACLPPNIVYNLTVYKVKSGSSGKIYIPIKSLSNAESLGVSSDAASYFVASSNVTFRVIPEKIGEHKGGGTLYILNCSDAYGWWITGYTAQSLAKDLFNILSPYFEHTIMVENTTQFEKLLNNESLYGEPLQNAVIINTFGEAVPIPESYAENYPGDSYAEYCYQLGKLVHDYNWTWVSIVGYPFYYVSNTGYFTESNNGWGIYGMKRVAAGGLNAFLEGLDCQPYSYNGTWITGSVGVVYLTSEAQYYCNYYGIYPSPYQTATRALPSSILTTYHLNVTLYIFNQVGSWIPGAVYAHLSPGETNITGSFFALGLTRTPDIRLTALGLLSYYNPRRYPLEYTARNATRLVVLQLGLMGGM